MVSKQTKPRVYSANRLQPIGAQEGEGKGFKEEIRKRGMGLGLRKFLGDPA